MDTQSLLAVGKTNLGKRTHVRLSHRQLGRMVGLLLLAVLLLTVLAAPADGRVLHVWLESLAPAAP